MKLKPVLAHTIRPGDQFKLNKCDFTPIYELHCRFADHIMGCDARTDCIRYCSVDNYDTVYKIINDADHN